MIREGRYDSVVDNHYWNVAEGFRSKGFFMWVKNMFQFIPFSLDLWLHFFCNWRLYTHHILLTFKTLVRLSWLKKTSALKSVEGANLNPAALLCVIALCLRGWVMILETSLLSEITALAAGNFKLKPLPNKYAFPSGAYILYKAIERSALSKVTWCLWEP